MGPQKVRDLCEIAASVQGDDVALLGHVASHLDLLADLATADLTLVVRAHEPNGLLVVAEGRPTSGRTLYGKSRCGEILAAEAEPLISKCLRSGRVRRSRFACLMGGRPVEQVAIPLRDAQGSVLAALGVDRSLLSGPWAPKRRPLREASEAIGDHLLRQAIRGRDLLCLIRMSQGVAIAEPGGQVLYADEAARAAWAKALGDDSPLDWLPSELPAGATLISRGEEPWGREREFEIGGTVFRRRDIPLGADAGSNVLTTIHDVSHLHEGQWMVSTRSAAFQEIHHRIKNNLQTISSLLRMQARREDSEQARESLRTAIGRVQSVAFVHEALSLDGSEEVDLKALAATLAEAAAHDLHRGGAEVTSAVLGPRILIPAARASQVALVLNEILQNAVKHAFSDGRAGSLTIRFDLTQEELTILVQDDGAGLPPGFDLMKTPTLGLQIARTIIESDLGGRLELRGNGGTRVTMRLPAALAH